VFRPIVYYNPMTHVIALFRQGFTDNYSNDAGIDPYYALFVALVLILVALVAERFFVRRWPAH
jgi:ABC-type polysaccharide/polyol phosphate export permease